MKKYERGEILEPILILIGLIIIVFLFVLPVGPITEIDSTNRQNSIFNLNSDDRGFVGYSNNSSNESRIRIGSGNARSESDAINEYIKITNKGDDSLTITGWFLTNAKGTKPYILNNKLQYTPSDQAVIPMGTTYLTSNGSNALSPIVLKPNEVAIVTTGSIGPRSDIPIVSFKTNKCSGYLEEDADYNFTPSLNQNCMSPIDEPGFNYLDVNCQEYIEGMNHCHIPNFETRDINGQSCRNCVDGRPGLSKICIDYLKAHYNYAGCLANHGNDSDFEDKEWRIFLDKKWEMWGAKKETITIFDQMGKEVDYLSY